MSFQERLYRLRRERGLSQEELGNILGVSRQAVQKWESGVSRPDLDNLTALAQQFSVSLDYLILGQEPPEPAPGVPPEAPAAPGVRTVYVADLRYLHYEYKSKVTLFGLPLVHINVGRYGLHWARGIVAVGNVATGVAALGGLSAGLLSVGGVGVGAVALAGLGSGLIALGGMAAGALCAVGGAAFSFGLAVGGCAIGGAWAVGGAASASQIAAGGAASAPIAIGQAVDGAVVFPADTWGPGTAEAIREAILSHFPRTPELLVRLFSQFH